MVKARSISHFEEEIKHLSKRRVDYKISELPDIVKTITDFIDFALKKDLFYPYFVLLTDLNQQIKFMRTLVRLRLGLPEIQNTEYSKLASSGFNPSHISPAIELIFSRGREYCFDFKIPDNCLEESLRIIEDQDKIVEGKVDEFRKMCSRINEDISIRTYLESDTDIKPRPNRLLVTRGKKRKFYYLYNICLDKDNKKLESLKREGNRLTGSLNSLVEKLKTIPERILVAEGTERYSLNETVVPVCYVKVNYLLGDLKD